MSELTETRLREISARVEAASEGPWVLDRHGSITDPSGLHQVALACGTAPMHGDPDRPPEEIRKANAALIAHAREDLPALVAEVRRLRSDCDRLVEITVGFVRRNSDSSFNAGYDAAVQLVREVATRLGEAENPLRRLVDGIADGLTRPGG